MQGALSVIRKNIADANTSLSNEMSVLDDPRSKTRRTTPTDPSDYEKALTRISILDYKIEQYRKQEDELRKQLEDIQKPADSGSRVLINEQQRGLFKNLSISPFGSNKAIAIDVYRYQIHLGGGEDAIKIPFVLAYGQSTEADDMESANATLIDPTQGWNLNLPFYWRVNKNKWLCDFEGSEFIGKDFGCRYGIEVSATLKEFEADQMDELSVGYSIKGSFAGLFPITQFGRRGERGYLSLDVGITYHNYKDEDMRKIYGAITDPYGNIIEYNSEFGVFNLEVQMEVYDSISISVAYFSPIGSKPGLSDITRFSISKAF